MQPRFQDWHHRTGEEIGGNHCKANCERQRHEHCPRDTLHEKRGGKNRYHAEHRQEPGDHHFAACFEHRATYGLGATEMGMDVLDRDDRFVHQNSDSEGEPAQRHQVERLPGGPKRDNRG